MNVKKGREFLEKMKSRDTKTELTTFLQNKNQYELTSLKQKYLDYLKITLPDLALLERSLRDQLSIEQPLVITPSLPAFFELFVEEQKLQFELAELYAKQSISSQKMQIIEQAIANPAMLFTPPRPLSTTEYATYKQKLSNFQASAAGIKRQLAVLSNNLPVCSATFGLFSQFETVRFCPKSLKENFELQVTSIVNDKGLIKLYARAFKIAESVLLVNYNAFRDKRRQNVEISNILQSLQGEILGVIEVFEGFEADEDIVIDSQLDGLKQKLNNNSVGSRQVSGSGSRPGSVKPIIQQKQQAKQLNMPPKALDLQRFQANKQANLEYQNDISQMNTLLKSDQSQNIYNQKISQLRQMKTELELAQKQKIAQKQLDVLLKRIRLAEIDAEKVKPNVEFNEEKLHQLSKNQMQRLQENENRKLINVDGIVINGEMKGYSQFAAGKEESKESFVAMNILAERGLLGTEAARVALNDLRGREIQNRFGGMLRDDVGRLFG